MFTPANQKMIILKKSNIYYYLSAVDAGTVVIKVTPPKHRGESGVTVRVSELSLPTCVGTCRNAGYIFHK